MYSRPAARKLAEQALEDVTKGKPAPVAGTVYLILDDDGYSVTDNGEETVPTWKRDEVIEYIMDNLIDGYKPAARNRADVSAHTTRSRRSLALLRQLAEEAGYLERGGYLSGLDEMLDELESGAARLTLEGATQ